MIYLPAIVVSAICFYMAHGLTPAVVLGIVTGLIDIGMKALPGGSSSKSPSGAVTFRQGPPSWAISARWFMISFWVGTVVYCGWWATK